MTTTKRMVFGRGYFVGEEAMEAGKIYGFEIVNERPAIEDAPLAANSIEPDPAQAFAEFVAPPAEVAEVEMAEAEVEIATPEIPEIAEAPEAPETPEIAAMAAATEEMADVAIRPRRTQRHRGHNPRRNHEHHHPPHHPHHPQHPHPLPLPHPLPPRHEHHPRHSGSSPRFAPPDYIPSTSPHLRAIDGGAIARCLYNNTYVWLANGQQFWYYPTFVGRRSIAGFRWTARGWVYMGFDLNLVQSFFCGGR